MHTNILRTLCDLGAVDQLGVNPAVTPIVVECDGFAIHGRRESFESDRRRDADLAAAGYIVLRITWRALADRPKWVVSVINGAVTRWERALAPSA